MKEAIQWWYQKKLRQWSSEANLIREQLLQESFAMRRSLELSSIESDKLTAHHQKYVERLENFHSSLKQLSDRLDPPYLNEGLPFALQYSVERWRERLPESQFKLNLPPFWQQKSSTDDFMVFSILEDLLNIQKTNTLSNNLIAIDLEQNLFISKFDRQLKVMFVGEKATNSRLDSDRVEEDTNGNRQELQYLQQIFEGLTSGSCKNISGENSDLWLFEW
ncbi:hypothetical protein IQ255_09845 [Pleurocapsales cyanobacterium LEGE 10410]|nr:hypothetical protein [Pleurocapsales cyanobacterium LEGE 10410]